ncbi:MAG: methyltransferase domain-containing protein [Candidatus Marinimicrobia bacterium]|nr:methyltransferase domain-containing protein [Candidatus Neomarinimicrobiota bacterium]
MQINPRKFAHKILLKWFTTDFYLEHLINFNETEISAQDRRFVEALVHQVIMHQRMLDHVMRKFISKKPKNPIYVALLMGICEILYMQVKDHAALNETVTMVGKMDHRSKGFVNAVLRKVLIFRDEKWEGYQKDPRIKPGIRFGFPDWMIARWIKQFGSETMEVLPALNERPRKMARIVKTGQRKKILDTLSELGVLEEVSAYHKDFIFIHSWQPLIQHELFTEGYIIAQDVSAAFPVMLVVNDSPKSVADVCCAPGGKLTALKQYCPKGTKIRGYDLNPRRIEDTQKTLDRLGMKDVSLKARDISKEEIPLFTHILIDAPCSGFGVIRKRTDLRWRRKEEEMPGLLKVQHDILENMSKYVKPGGMMVYSTCTFDREENWNQVKQFINRHPEFSIAPADPAIFPKELITDYGAIESLPHQHSCEGSFAIALRKC